MNHESPGYVGTQDDVIVARIGAFVLDHVASIAFGALLGFGLATVLDSVLGVYVGMVGGVVAYFVVLEWAFGQTPGKRVAGVVVVSGDGGRITVRQSLVRNTLRIIDGAFGYVLGLAVMLLSSDVQRVGDHAADTVVVRARR